MSDRGYRDPLDADEDVQTSAAAAIDHADVAAARARLEREFTIAGRALLDAADEMIGSPLMDGLEAAALVVKLTEHITARQSLAITKLVVDGGVPARDVAVRLGWTQAAVAFACKARRTT